MILQEVPGQALLLTQVIMTLPGKLEFPFKHQMFFMNCRSTLSLYDVPPKSSQVSQVSLLAAQDLYDTPPPSRAVSILSASTYRAEDLSE